MLSQTFRTQLSRMPLYAVADFPSLKMKGPNLFYHDNAPLHKVWSKKTRFAKADVEEF